MSKAEDDLSPATVMKRLVSSAENYVSYYPIRHQQHSSWDMVATTMAKFLIDDADQLLAALIVGYLMANGIPIMSLEKYFTPDGFKAFSRSIKPILQVAVETDDMEKQLQRLKLGRDTFMVETR